MTKTELWQSVNYRENEEVKENLSSALIDRGKDDRPPICLNCFYGGFFGHSCGVLKDENGKAIKFPIDSLGVCDRYVVAPYRC